MVSIPEVFLLSLNWKEGDELDFKIENKKLLISKHENVQKDSQNSE